MRNDVFRRLPVRLGVILVLVLLGCKTIQGVQVQVSLPTETESPTGEVETTLAPLTEGEIPGLPGTWQLATVTPGFGLNQRFQPLGQIGGNSYALAMDGNLAYLGVGPRLYALDISQPDAPVVLGQSEPLPGVVRGIALRPPHAYIAAGKGDLRVLDVSEPRQPREVGALTGLQWAMAVVIDADRMYIADNAHGLWIADISTPTQPRLLGSYQLKQPAAALTVRGTTVYVVHMTGGLAVIEASNPSNPVLMAELPLPQMSAGIALSGNYALVAAGIEGLWVIDISNPAAPQKVASQKTTWADGIAVEGGLAYLSDNLTGLMVLDISDPRNPRSLGSAAMTLFSQQVPGSRQIVARAGWVFLANQNQGMIIVDATDPANPVQAGSLDAPLSGAAFDSVAVGSEVYVTRDFIGLGGVNVADPAEPNFLGSEASFIKGAPVRTSWKFDVKDRHAFAVDVNLGFRVLDLESLEQIARIDNPQSWSSIAISGDLAYATTTEHDPQPDDPEIPRSLRIVQISDPAHPQVIGLLRMENNARSIAARENYVYYPDALEINQLAEGEFAGMHVIDVSDPSNPVQVGEADTTGHCPQATSIVLKDSFAFVGDQVSGLCVIDIHDPADPRLVYTWKDAPPIYDMALVGDRIFAACYSHVGAIDISAPTAPRLEDITVTPGLAWGIDAAGEVIYIADMDGGLNILGYH